MSTISADTSTISADTGGLLPESNTARDEIAPPLPDLPPTIPPTELPKKTPAELLRLLVRSVTIDDHMADELCDLFRQGLSGHTLPATVVAGASVHSTDVAGIGGGSGSEAGFPAALVPRRGLVWFVGPDRVGKTCITSLYCKLVALTPAATHFEFAEDNVCDYNQVRQAMLTRTVKLFISLGQDDRRIAQRDITAIWNMSYADLALLAASLTFV